MGEVYEAEQIPLGRRKVALKVIRNDRATEAMRDRFEREQRILAWLHQTNIVPIYVAGEADGLHYLVMPFIDGAVLHDLIAAARRQPPGEAPSLTTLIEAAGRQRGRSQASDTPPASVAGRPRLSPGYFRLVAALMADVAEAIGAVHRAGFLHRDLKPANLMVDRQGKCWIIDFGLACDLAEAAEPAAPGMSVAPQEIRTVSGVAGTPEYMAPEQRLGKAGPRSDVWGLGATLYELAYLEQAASRGNGAAAGVPKDLAAICDRALREEPAERYASAGDLARDLRRWLAHEPTEARGATPWRWALLWARRHPGWAAATAAGALAVLVLVSSVFVFEHQEATQARERATTAEEHERKQRREALLQQIDRLPLGQRRAGWTRKGWALVEEAAQLGVDERLRELAAGLDGVDADLLQSFSDVSASSVAFDRNSKRLLMGGLAEQPARLWEGAGTAVRPSRRTGEGPVAFADDGTPLQLVVDAQDQSRIVLWDVDRQRLVRRFAMPGKDDKPVLAMTPDGAYVAAGSGGRVQVWETRTGQRVCDRTSAASAVAMAPDGSLLAAGDTEGRIEVWSLPSGKHIADLHNEGVEVQSIAFDRDVRRGSGEPGPMRWLLAAGSSRSIQVWALPSGQHRARCAGSEYDVHTLVFSPDHMTLASAGRFAFCLWDLASGKRLLEARAGDEIRGLAFSPDGMRLASACRPALTPGSASVWSIDPGRRLRKLRGLNTPVSKVCFSADGRLLAALGHGWEVAIWETDSWRLLHVLQVPRGQSADNAALAFGPDCQFAFASGERATLWRLGVGHAERTASWPLPMGLVDGLAFVGRERLILCRAEPRDGVLGPPPAHAFVLRVYDLLGSTPTRPLVEAPDLYWRVLNGRLSTDGQFMVFAGRDGPPGTPKLTAAYETGTGKRLWERRTTISHDSALIPIDPRGAAVTVQAVLQQAEVLDIGTGKKIADIDEDEVHNLIVCIGPNPTYRLVQTINHAPDWKQWQGWAISRLGHRGRDILLRGDEAADTSVAVFDHRGRLLALGNTDGSVSLWDIETLRERLGEVALGWAE